MKLIKRILRSVSYRSQRYITRCKRSVTKLKYRLPTLELRDLVSGPLEIPELILDDICLPPYQGPKSHNDLIPLLSIATMLQPGIIVELGTAHGNTAANLCKVCPNCHVFTVNAPAAKQTGDIVTYSLDSEEIGRVYTQYGYSSRVTQILQNTLDLNLAQYLGPGSADLAIIDACHDTDYVINDFFKVLPFMSQRGLVLFHDTHPSMEGHLAGSYMACMSLRRKGYDIRHIQNTWWGIWSRTKLPL